MFFFFFFINKDPFVDKTLQGVISVCAELRDYCSTYCLKIYLIKEAGHLISLLLMRIDTTREVSPHIKAFLSKYAPLHACLNPNKHVTVLEERVDIVWFTVVSCYWQEIPVVFTDLSTLCTSGEHTGGGGLYKDTEVLLLSSMQCI